MRLLLDANLSPTLVKPLTAAGHETVHVADIGLLTANDEPSSTTRSPRTWF
ncbi:MAG: DUF5615 family PIN-like protein [Mycobacteriales bacterium]